ncbi:MAG: DUF2092 domain-containing protein, partial [Firmicutes bacterium]|nr:DUF2092 domain-containing protein [Bacillota bacterium]
MKSSANHAPPGTTLVYDGKTLTLYDPANNQVFQIQDRAQLVLLINLPQERIFPQLQVFQAQRFLSSLSQNANVTVNGAATVAGRPTTIVNVTPQSSTPAFKTAKLWLDDQTKVPLRADAIRDDGSTLVSIEYSQFDPTTRVSDGEFTFTPPSNAQVVKPTPDQIENIAGFQDTTLQDARSKAGFPLLQPANLPAGASQQAIRAGSFGSAAIVAFFYGSSPQDISTTLIEKPASLTLPTLRGAEAVSIDGTTGHLYQAPGMVVE